MEEEPELPGEDNSGLDDSTDNSETEDEGQELLTFTVDAPRQVQAAIDCIISAYKEVFLKWKGTRYLHATKFKAMLDNLQRMFWDHALIPEPINLRAAVSDRPPIGSRFISDGSYVTLAGHKVNRPMRNCIQLLKEKFEMA